MEERVAALWRIEGPRLIGALARKLRDFGEAEDLAQDALEQALRTWPAQGVPANPAAWLMAVAQRRAIDALRARKLHAEKQEEFARELETLGLDHVPPPQSREQIEDDQLRLIFTACHPLLAPEARAALALKVLAGLTNAEIARAFLAQETAIAQRIVRAKRLLAEACVPFEQPQGDERRARLASVLEVIYLIFNEGHAATSGPAWMRPALAQEALRLARQLVGLMPAEDEVLGLAALLELSSARLPARLDAQGRPVLLMQQDRRRWDRGAIYRGLELLERVHRPGPYSLQARIAAVHARALRAEDTDWSAIVLLYDGLAQLAPSPVLALNQAVAIGMASGEGYGPAAALALIDELAHEKLLVGYPWLHSARGEMLERLGRVAEAREAFARARDLSRNDAERQLLDERVSSLASEVSANIVCISAKKRS
ncbi:MAG: sigma-70 family RNA polymerase sigma factor [Paucibacter sp.]|nr:sigma-70 family RNA polymerase sigma factor [Roseateles sp.]